MSERDTYQSALWRSNFGDAYIGRNPTSPQNVHAAALLWAQIFGRLHGNRPRSILEVGANVGINLHALRSLTDAELYAVEPNATARAQLAEQGVLPSKNILDGVASGIALP